MAQTEVKLLMHSSYTPERKYKNKAHYVMGFVLVIFLVCIAFWISNIFFPSKSNKQDELEEHSKQLIDSLRSRNISLGVAVAKKICTDIPKLLPPKYMTELFENNGIQLGFINEKYNKWDFIYWYNAIYFFNIAKALTEHDKVKNDYSTLKILFDAVHNRIEPILMPSNCIPWPYNAWNIKKGLCDRQAWLLSELAYQLGYETQIVYLIKPKTLISQHTICEIRKGDRVWTADPFTGILLANISISDVRDSEKLKKKMWPDKPALRLAVNESIFFTPSYPQAYAPRNQLLYVKLKYIFKEYFPRFGEPPIMRQKKYLMLTGNKKDKFRYKFWFYPFRLLRIEMRMSSNQ